MLSVSRRTLTLPFSRLSRIPLPFSLEEYARGQLYMIAKASQQETQGDEGIEVVTNEEFEDERGKGIFTFKKIHLTDKLPQWIRRIFPFVGDVLTIEEKSWNLYPYSRTEYRSHLFGEKCKITVESRHVANDRGTSANIFNLSKSALAARKIQFLDIADSSLLDAKNYNEDEDPSLFKSTRTNPPRGPLRPGRWFESFDPIICAYKLVTVEFAYKALRSRIESFIHDIIAPIYLKTHRQAVCWMDEWIHLSTGDIRKLDIQVAAKLKRQQQQQGKNQSSADSEVAAKVEKAVKSEKESNEDDETIPQRTGSTQAASTSSSSSPAAVIPKTSFLKLRERLHLKSKL